MVAGDQWLFDNDSVVTEDDVSINEDISREDADAMLAHDLNALSLQERNKVYEEIHGVDAPIEETPEIIELGLENLELELQDIRRRNVIFRDLMNTLPSTTLQYLSSTKFRLQFLRADLFDIDKAAMRMVNYIIYVKDMFGVHCLGRPLVMEDLDKDDIACLRGGVFQFLPSRDVAGRIVYVHRPQPNIEDRVKTFFYLLVAATVADIETQRRGYVWISYYPGRVTFESSQWNFVSGIRRALFAIPIRNVACHYCHNSLALRPILSFGVLVAPSYIRTRLRVYHGSHKECLAKLISFGIPVDRFPYDDDLNLKLRSHSRWLARQRVLDKMILAGTFDHWNGSQIPGMRDILIGTGAHVPEHAGNQWLGAILEQYLDEYNGAISAGKHKIETIKKVVARVEAEGGRFLKQWENIWCRIDNPSEKNEKVIHVFRGMNKKVNRRQQTQQVASALKASDPPDSKRPRISCSSSGNDVQQS